MDSEDYEFSGTGPGPNAARNEAYKQCVSELLSDDNKDKRSAAPACDVQVCLRSSANVGQIRVERGVIVELKGAVDGKERSDSGDSKRWHLLVLDVGTAAVTSRPAARGSASAGNSSTSSPSSAGNPSTSNPSSAGSPSNRPTTDEAGVAFGLWFYSLGDTCVGSLALDKTETTRFDGVTPLKEEHPSMRFLGHHLGAVRLDSIVGVASITFVVAPSRDAASAKLAAAAAAGRAAAGGALWCACTCLPPKMHFYLSFDGLAIDPVHWLRCNPDALPEAGSFSHRHNPVVAGGAASGSGAVSRAPLQHRRLRVLDMFAGAGGLGAGLEAANGPGLRSSFTTCWAVENDEAAAQALRGNHPGAAVWCCAAATFLDRVECVAAVRTWALAMEPEDDDDDDEQEEEEEDEASGWGVEEICDVRWKRGREPSLLDKHTTEAYRGVPTDDIQVCIRWTPGKWQKDRHEWLDIDSNAVRRTRTGWYGLTDADGCRERLLEFVQRARAGSCGGAPPLPLPGDADVLAAGPPCQGVSGANKFHCVSDARNTGFYETVRTQAIFRPSFSLIENVCSIWCALPETSAVGKRGRADDAAPGGGRRVAARRSAQSSASTSAAGAPSPSADGEEVPVSLAQFARMLLQRSLEQGYQAKAQILLASDFGAAQHRPRVFFALAALGEARPATPLPTHDTGGMEYARSIPGLRSEVQNLILSATPSPETGRPANAAVTCADVLSALVEVEPYSAKDAKDGRDCSVTWGPSPPSPIESVFRRRRLGDAGSSSQQLASTVTLHIVEAKSTKGCYVLEKHNCSNTLVGRVTMALWAVPDQEQRAPSVRESIRLSGFPDWFAVCGTQAEQRKQIGNAVPAPLGHAMGQAILAAADWALGGLPHPPVAMCFDALFPKPPPPPPPPNAYERQRETNISRNRETLKEIFGRGPQ